MEILFLDDKGQNSYVMMNDFAFSMLILLFPQRHCSFSCYIYFFFDLCIVLIIILFDFITLLIGAIASNYHNYLNFRNYRFI